MDQEEYHACSPGKDDPPVTLRGKAFIIYAQPYLRLFATSLGNYRHCPLPKCRRKKQCAGCHPIDKISEFGFFRFPPCVDTNERHSALMAEARRVVEEVRVRRMAGHAEPGAPTSEAQQGRV